MLTISDTRTEENDGAVSSRASFVQEAGHEVAGSAIVKDDAAAVQACIAELTARGPAKTSQARSMSCHHWRHWHLAAR